MATTVSLCMIVKNEANNIGALLESLLATTLTEIVVVDTGSTDATLEIVKRLKDPRVKLHHFVWVDDFSAARNYSFSLASGDFVGWLDGDDKIDPKQLNAFLAQINRPGVDAWTLDYVYNRDSSGKPTIVLQRERFIRRSISPQWVGAIHEHIDITGMKLQHSTLATVEHNRAGKAIDPERNVKILEKAYEKNPNDPRTCYYLGKELFDKVNPRGIGVLEKYLTLPGRWFDDEINARARLGRHYVTQKRHRDAIKTVEEIYHLDSSRNRAEMYFVYGLVEEDLGNYEVAIKWYDRCIVDPPTSNYRVITTEYYTWHPAKRAAICAQKLGQWVKMAHYANLVLKFIPNDVEQKAWVDSLSVDLGGGLGVIETDGYLKSTGVALRRDAKILQRDVGLIGNKVPTRPLDGVVFVNTEHPDVCIPLLNAVKPGGFVWELYDTSVQSPLCPVALKNVGTGKTLFQELVRTQPSWLRPGWQLRCYVRVLDAPMTVHIGRGSLDFGPYRIRLHNLRQSFVKAGHLVVDTPINDLDLSVAQNATPVPAKVRVIDVCEKLEPNQYNIPAIREANAVCAASDLLKDHFIHKVFPYAGFDKPIFVLEDHAEMPDGDWL